MDLSNALQFFSAAFVAEVIGTFAGFGSATLFTPAAAFFVGIKTAIAFAAVLHLMGALVRAVYFWRYIDWKIFGWFIFTDIIFTAWGATIIVGIAEDSVKNIIGLFLVGYSLLALVSRSIFITKPSKLKLLFWGAISGFLSGLIGIGGAARSAALQMFSLKKRSYLGTGAIMGVATDLVRIPVYMSLGVVTLRGANLSLAGGLTLTALVGALIGSKLAGKVSENLFRKIVHILLLAAGVYFILF